MEIEKNPHRATPYLRRQRGLTGSLPTFGAKGQRFKSLRRQAFFAYGQKNDMSRAVQNRSR